MNIDTLINARWIIPVEPANMVYENHSLAINDGRILDILPTKQALLNYQADSIEQLSDHAIIPGLINCHTHAAMSLLRGIADDLPLMEWLEQRIWILEQRWVGEDFVRDGTKLAIAEMIRSGTTCFNDMYLFPEITVQQVIRSGIRAAIGLILIDFPTAWANTSEQYIEKGLALREQIRHQPLITTTFAPHAPYTVADKLLNKMRSLADEMELAIHMHIHETTFEVNQAVKQTGHRPLHRLHQLGILTPDLIAVHMTQMTDDEIELLAQTGTNIVHCPESNLKLASGFCPVAQCLEAGINVALGTDGAASNNDLDMIGEMHTAALLGKAVANNPSALPAATVLQMATLNSAKALGLDDEIGSLRIGKSADITAIDLSQLETQPLYNPIAQIIYCATRSQVSDVWVAGRQLLKQRKLTTIDQKQLRSKISIWQQQLK